VSFLRQEVSSLVLVRSDLERHVLDLHATSMATAIIRASGTSAPLTLVAREALAFTSFTVANAPVGALSILVMVAQFIRSVYPRELKRTNPLRAVTAVMAHANSPVVEALTHSVLSTGTMARASIVAASSLDRGNSKHHECG
jgi:hypothetical protein